MQEVQLDRKNPFEGRVNFFEGNEGKHSFFEGNETKEEFKLRLELQETKNELKAGQELDLDAEFRKVNDLNLLPQKTPHRKKRPSNIKECVEMALKNAKMGLEMGGADAGENLNMKPEMPTEMAPKVEKGKLSLNFLDELLFKDLPRKSPSCGSKDSSASIDEILKEIRVVSRQCEF